MDNRRAIIKSWEVVLAILIVFFVCSASLYWYDYFNKNKKYSIEGEMRSKWEKDTLKWQSDATNNINAFRKSQQEVINIINFNISSGRLVIPHKEKK